jgi:hypothetical protein
MYDFKPICGKPCKLDADCASPQRCNMAAKSNEPTMGMSQARANEIYVCATRTPSPASSAPTRAAPRSSAK